MKSSEASRSLPGHFVCLFVWDPQPHFSRGVNSQRRTYGDHPLPPRPLVTPGPCLSLCSLSPRTFVMHPATGPYPPLSSCPIHIPYRVSGLFLPCFSVLHIYSNPTEKNPSTNIKPHIQTVLIHYFNKQTIKRAVYHYIVSPPVSSVPTCSSAPHLHKWLPSPQPFSLIQHKLC